MKRLAFVPLLVLPALALAADGDVAKGKTTYAANCMACHGTAGDGAAAPALDPKPANFTDAAFWTGKTDEDVKAVIKSGKPGTTMAPFAQLDDTQLTDLVAYLRTFEPKG